MATPTSTPTSTPAGGSGGAAGAAGGSAGAVFTSELREHLARHGWVVVPGVLTTRECKDFRLGMCEDVFAWTKGTVDLKSPDTWRQWRKFFPMHSMLVQHGGLGRAQTPEAIRFHPAVADVFAALHNVPPTELLVSFDALSIHVPGEQTPGGEKCGFFRAPWWHTDQGPAPTGLKHAGGGEPDYCVQGQVVLNGARSCDATLGILDGSHLHWREFFETFPAKDPRADWQQLDSANPAHVEFFTSRGCAVVRVAAPEGSMVLWDSRAMHCGVEPERGRPAPYPQRMVTYVCMLPRPHPSTKGLGTLLARRRTAYEEARVTSHHPFRWHTFPMKPRTYGEEEPDVLRPTVDPLEELPPRARALVDGGLEYTMQVAAAQGGSRPARKRAGGGGGSGSRKRSCVVDLTADTDSDSS